MESEFRFMPPQASTQAAQVDLLYYFLIAVSTFFTLLICVLIFAFAFRYRRGSPASRANISRGDLRLEIAWSVGPLILMLISFAWGAKLFMNAARPPADALDVYVVAKQWMWKLQHEEGKGEIDHLHVPVNTPVRLTMISEDVIHSFFIPAFRVKQDVLPGRFTTLWFEATRPGRYHLFCAEFCGTSHWRMRGEVVVLPQPEYAQWISQEGTVPAEAAGKRLFTQFGCDDCHSGAAGDEGPSLVNFFRRTHVLEAGRTAAGDIDYFRHSVRNPRDAVVAGFEPVMPAYPTARLSEEQLLQLAAYIRTLQEPLPTEVEP